MKNNIIFATICTVMIFGVANCKENTPNNQSSEFEMVVLGSTPSSIFMPRRPFPGPHHDMFQFNDDLKLTDAQREKLYNLGKKHHNDIKELDENRDAIQERYQERFESVLTDEQFRKIEKMRKELRKDIKKLNEKRQKMIESHRNDFEAILTPEQKEMLKNKFKERH